MPLYTKFVKHTFESKPQPVSVWEFLYLYYTQNSSNTLLKANHNRTESDYSFCQLYTKFVKHTFESKPQLYKNRKKYLKIIHKIRQTHFWKQTTTFERLPKSFSQLYTKFVKHTFESKPQLAQCTERNIFIIHKIRQTHFWKQTTTQGHSFLTNRQLYTKFVKHTFESKPQHCLTRFIFHRHYTQNSSNTLLKANHNLRNRIFIHIKLYTKFVKHTFESKPQLVE